MAQNIKEKLHDNPSFGKKKVKKMKKSFDKHLLSINNMLKLSKKKLNNKKDMIKLLSIINKKVKNDLKTKEMRLSKRIIKHCLNYYKLKYNNKKDIQKMWSLLTKKHKESIKAFRFDKKRYKIVVKKNTKSKSYKTQGKKGPRKDTKYLKNKFSFGTTLEDMPEELIYTIASQTGPEEANFFTKMDILKKIPMLQLLI